VRSSPGTGSAALMVCCFDESVFGLGDGVGGSGVAEQLLRAAGWRRPVAARTRNRPTELHSQLVELVVQPPIEPEGNVDRQEQILGRQPVDEMASGPFGCGVEGFLHLRPLQAECVLQRDPLLEVALAGLARYWSSRAVRSCTIWVMPAAV
jgi:hypothetical protein